MKCLGFFGQMVQHNFFLWMFHLYPEGSCDRSSTSHQCTFRIFWGCSWCKGWHGSPRSCGWEHPSCRTSHGNRVSSQSRREQNVTGHYLGPSDPWNWILICSCAGLGHGWDLYNTCCIDHRPPQSPHLNIYFVGIPRVWGYQKPQHLPKDMDRRPFSAWNSWKSCWRSRTGCCSCFGTSISIIKFTFMCANYPYMVSFQE